MSRRAGTSKNADRVLSLHGLVVFAFLYVPIGLLVFFSFSDSASLNVWGGWSLRWYRRMFDNGPLLTSIRNSVVVALVSTVVSTVLGTAAAIALERYRRWLGKRTFDALLYLPVIIPDVTMGVMLLMWFTTIGWRLSLTTIILSHIAFNISFVAIVVRARLAGLDPALEEAAMDLYADRWRAFRRVTLPLIAPGIAGGALLALTLSLDDVVITSLVQGPGSTTLPVFVFGLIKRQVTPEINAVSTVMLVASIVLVFGSLAFQRRKSDSVQ
ncbi:MAG TPA: ABC transporter permease [Actinobacteria bacterium]|nr:ABC transporter permease [Actinomycetota bacterium]